MNEKLVRQHAPHLELTGIVVVVSCRFKKSIDCGLGGNTSPLFKDTGLTVRDVGDQTGSTLPSRGVSRGPLLLGVQRSDGGL